MQRSTAVLNKTFFSFNLENNDINAVVNIKLIEKIKH